MASAPMRGSAMAAVAVAVVTAAGCGGGSGGKTTTTAPTPVRVDRDGDRHFPIGRKPHRRRGRHRVDTRSGRIAGRVAGFPHRVAG